MEHDIYKQTKKLDIPRDIQKLLNKLIYAELFRVIYMSHSSNIRNIQIEKHTLRNGDRVWAKVSIFVNMEDKINIFELRPFIDTAEVQVLADAIRIQKTYFLYSDNEK